VATLTVFDPQAARTQFENRTGSLESDIKRCFCDIPGGPGPAFFPAVLYAVATIDYFSSYWAGWNDSAGDRSRNQTVRLVGFLVKYLGYDERASKVGVAIWRHKLMHTGEPRAVKAKSSGERFIWETGTDLQDHMKLTPTGNPNESILRFDLHAVVSDLRCGILGASGYLADLCASPDLQKKFLGCYNEMENYSVDI
jgi:hypothetical protein